MSWPTWNPVRPEGKPTVSDGGHQITISDCKPHQKNTLQGFFSATLPSGLVFHSLMLHERNCQRWISFPAREYIDVNGEKQYARFVDFISRERANPFRDQILAAL